MPRLHFYDDHSPRTRFICPIPNCNTSRDTLESLLQHAKDFSSFKKEQHHSFLMELMKDRTCTLVGCGRRIENLQELFQHMDSGHNWTWARRNDPEFEYTFSFGVDTHDPDISDAPLTVPEFSDSGLAEILSPSRLTHPIEPSPLCQFHKEKFGKLPMGTTFPPSDLRHATAVNIHHQERPEGRKERGDDPEKSNTSEILESNNKIPNEEDSKNFFSLTEFPKSLEEVETVRMLLRPTRMQYKHLTGESIFMSDTLSDCYLMEWHSMQMTLEYWWTKQGLTGQAPELIFISDWSVERVVWTYEWDARVFGPVLDLKGFVREQEFKSLSPIMPECLV